MSLPKNQKALPPQFNVPDNQPSLIAQAMASHGKPGHDFVWRPSPDEEYHLHVKILSDEELTLARKRAVAFMAKNYDKDALPSQTYETFLDNHIIAEIVSLCIYEGEIKTVTDEHGESKELPRRLVWTNAATLRKDLSPDRIAQLFKFYTAWVEQDSPSYHHLSTIQDMETLCKQLAEDAKGDSLLFLGSMGLLPLAEFTLGLVRYFTTLSQSSSLPTTMDVNPPISNGDTSSSTDVASRSSLPSPRELSTEEVQDMIKNIGILKPKD